MSKMRLKKARRVHVTDDIAGPECVFRKSDHGKRVRLCRDLPLALLPPLFHHG